MQSPFILSTVAGWLDQHAQHLLKLVVAYSGGRDSHVLLTVLQALKATRPQLVLRAIHVNHGLHPQATQWAHHCQNICDGLAIPLKVLALGLKPQRGDSIEAAARTQRYLALEQALEENELLVTAHSLEDQAETCLLQLLRGTGPLGLGGIAAFKSLQKGYLGRPLLTVKRHEIAAFAQARQLVWVEDETNQDLRFRRNFLRHIIFPQLQKVYPALNTCIARSAHHCSQSQLLLDEFLEEELKQCLGETSEILNLVSFKKLSSFKQPYVLRHWLRLNHLPTPSAKKLAELLVQMLTAAADTQPCVTWKGAHLRRYQEALYSLPVPSASNSLNALCWDLHAPLQLPDGSRWQAKLKHGQGWPQSKVSTSVQIAFRQGGERCRLADRTYSRSLKKILQERRIPPWQRDKLPLFYHQQELIGVGDLFICEGWQNTNPQEEGWVIEKIQS